MNIKYKFKKAAVLGLSVAVIFVSFQFFIRAEPKASASEHSTEPTITSATVPAEPTEVVTNPTETTEQPTEAVEIKPTANCEKLYQKQRDKGYLIAIDNPDPVYQTAQVNLCEADRDEICRIVYGESGNQGYVGMCLIAQALKDAWCFDGCYSNFKELRKAYQYQGYSDVYSQEAVEAVNFIFDQNGSALQHRILYMYAPNICNSSWHESQCYVLDYLDVRFFDRWY